MYHDIDSATPANIDLQHAKTHSGLGFSYSREITLSASGSTAILIVPVVGESIHFGGTVSSKGAAIARIYKNPTVTNVGSSVVWLNRNDVYQGVKTLNTKIYTNPSYNVATVPACRLAAVESIAAGVKAEIGGLVSNFTEIVMNSSNSYVLEVVDNAAAANNATINVQVFRGGPIS